MKTFTSIIAAVALFAAPAVAQDSTSQSGAVSGSQSAAVSGSALQVNNTYNTPDTTKQTITQNGGYKVQNVPAVSAPAIFGGGHPCLQGASGGAAGAGWGLSLGGSKAETVCMLWVIGQPEAAIRALAATDPTACKALNDVGYYRVGGSTAPFECGEKTIRGGVYSTKTDTNQPLYSKCARRSDGKIQIKYTKAGKANIQMAQTSCANTLR